MYAGSPIFVMKLGLILIKALCTLLLHELIKIDQICHIVYAKNPPQNSYDIPLTVTTAP